MKPTLQAWLNTTIRWEKFQSQSGRGAPAYAAPVDLMCYLEGEQRIVRNVAGEEKLSDWTMIIADSRASEITEKDRITLPSGVQRLVLSISPRYDRKGQIDHYEVSI